jgi:hypothetical protein
MTQKTNDYKHYNDPMLADYLWHGNFYPKIMTHTMLLATAYLAIYLFKKIRRMHRISF